MYTWWSPLWNFYNELPVCLLSTLVPCVVEGMNAKLFGEKQIIHTVGYCLIPCFTGAKLRGKMRNAYKIDGSFMNDCVVHTFCIPCSLAQEYCQIKKGPVVKEINRS